jgi:hypothetical protein
VALLGRRELLEAHAELDEELKKLNVRGEVFIVGGAAMAIAYDTRRATADVDAVFIPSNEVRTAASRVAERLNLDPTGSTTVRRRSSQERTRTKSAFTKANASASRRRRLSTYLR